MKQHTIDKIEKVFKELIINEHENSEGYCLIVPTTNDWEYDLPENVKSSNYMQIDIINWTREESYLDDSGIYIKTAFNENENSKFFPFSQIVGLLSKENEIIIAKPHSIKTQEPEKKYSLTDLIKESNNSEGIKHSMSKLSLVKSSGEPETTSEIKIKPKKKKKSKKKKPKKLN